MTGVPAGRPTIAAASGVRSPSRPPGATSSGSQSRSIGAARQLQSPGLAHGGRPLGRQGDARDRVAPSGAAIPQPRARRADRPPVDLRVLLGPTRLPRDVRDDRDPGVPDDRAARIEDEGADALRPDVDREDVIAAPRRPLRSSRASVRSTPGFIMRSGSNRAETSRSTPSPSSPFSPANQRRWSRPTPCWWLIVPPWRTITSLAAFFRRRHRSRVSSGSAARRKTYVAYRLEPLG